MSALLAAAEGAPAGGAPLSDVAIVSGVAGLISLLIALCGLRLRSGGLQPVRRAADGLGRVTGLAHWAALPLAIMLVGLVSAGYGMTADIDWHFTLGRDASALGNPTHYPILVGLMVWLAGAFLAVTLPRAGEKPGAGAVPVDRRHRAPIGGLVALVGVSISLTSFPLDDLWHRAFGQDVTFWGPTHLLLVGGGVLATFGMMLVVVTGYPVGRAARVPLPLTLGRLVVGAALTVFPPVLLLEWHFGMPQANMIHDPLLIAMSTGGLVVSRLWIGRGAALAAAVLAFAIALVLGLLAGPLLGHPLPYFNLFVPGALAVEAAALVAGTRNPWRFAVLGGALAGTLGLLGEWAWTDAYRPLHWAGAMMPEALALGAVVATGAALLGVVVTGGLDRRGELIASPAGGRAFAAGAVAIVGTLVLVSLPTAPEGVTAQITVQDVPGAAQREAYVTARFDPPSAADGADWVMVGAWQGGGLVHEALVRTADGAWRTTSPVPMHGDWKTLLRLSKDGHRGGVGLYAPADPAIPAAAVSTAGTVTRPVADEQRFLQRERKPDTPPWLWALGMTVVWSVWALMVAVLAWAMRAVALDDARVPVPRAVTARLPRRLALGR